MTETNMSPTKPNEPACTECSRLASRVEELEAAIRLLVEFIEPVEGGSIFEPKRDMAHLHKLVGYARKILAAHPVPSHYHKHPDGTYSPCDCAWKSSGATAWNGNHGASNNSARRPAPEAMKGNTDE